MAREMEYVGTIKKCPNCGAVIESFQSRCASCGFELNDNSVNTNIKEFAERINEIDENPPTYSYISMNMSNTSWAVEKNTYISSYPIPNTREALLEFMMGVSQFALAHGPKKSMYGSVGVTMQEYKDHTLIYNAWLSKMKQIHNKAKIALKGDPALARIEEIHNETLRQLAVGAKAERKKILPLMIAGIVAFVMLFGIGIGSFAYIGVENKRLEGVVKEVETLIADEKYDAALIKAQSLHYQHDDHDSKVQWDNRREALIEQIKGMKAEKKTN